jgi:hypothetical protein
VLDLCKKKRFLEISNISEYLFSLFKKVLTSFTPFSGSIQSLEESESAMASIKNLGKMGHPLYIGYSVSVFSSSTLRSDWEEMKITFF